MNQALTPLPDSMTAVVCHGPGDYRIEQLPVPEPGPGEALIKVEAVGICAGDVKCFHGAPKFWGDDLRPPWAETEAIPGHEFVGTVVAIDDLAASRWSLAVGDRAIAEQILPCGTCRYCEDGTHWMCAPHDMYGFKRCAPGAMAEYMIYRPNSIVHPISSTIPAHHAAFAEPLACALHAVERATITDGDVVVVAGCGPIGLGVIAGAVTETTNAVVALDRVAHRLDLARRCGATHTINIAEEDPRPIISSLTNGYGADIYLDSTGHPAGVSQGLDLLRKLGTFVEYSVFSDPVSVDWSIISDDKELDVRGAHLGAKCWPAAIQMIESGRLPLDDICSHQLPLAQFEHGLDLVREGTDSIKVTLIPSHEAD